MSSEIDPSVPPPRLPPKILLVARLLLVAVVAALLVFRHALLTLALWPVTVFCAVVAILSAHFAIDHLRRGEGPWVDNLVVAGLAGAVLLAVWV